MGRREDVRMPIKTKLARGVTLSCITVSDLAKARHLFVDLLGLEVKDYQEEHKWMENRRR